MKVRHLFALVAFTGCRIGGTRENPYDAVYFPDAAADAAHVVASTPSGDDGGSFDPGADGDATSADDGGAAGDDGGGGLDAGADDASGGGNCSPTVAVCDPVHDTGCNPFQQCDINPSLPATPTGQCVFGGAEGGGACTVSIFTESCPAKSTCVDGGCRQLCFCNTDCPAHECCSDRKGAPGFTLCGSCS